MKKNALMILLTALVSFGALAQDKKEGHKRNGEKPTPEKMAEWRTKRVKETVGLNDEQYKKLYAINLDEAKKNHEKMEERRKALKAERTAYKAKLETILTPEQLKKLEDSKGERTHRNKGDFKKRGDSSKGREGKTRK